MSKNSFKRYASEKYVDDKLLEFSGQVGGQSDWNQNDTTAVDYIKNRPFYEAEQYNVLFDEEVTLTVQLEYGVFRFPSELVFEDGKTYQVHINNKLYYNNYISNDSTNFDTEYGNTTLAENRIEIYHYADNIHLKIVEVDTVIKQLDEKYLPKHTHSYNDLDDKPFYDTSTTVEINETINYGGFYAFGSISSELHKALIENKVENILIDGKSITYVETSSHYGGCVEYDWYDDSKSVTTTLCVQLNEPQAYLLDISQMDHQVTGQFTVTGSYINGKLKQIDEKFIPDTIARKDDIDAAVSNLVGLAPEERNTIEELAKAIEDHEDVTDAINSAIVNKVDKVEGKGLSTNDFTDELKAKYDEMYENKNIFDGIYLRDIENGQLYLVQMKGGTLVSSSKTESIKVSKPPTKMMYSKGESFDPTGMVVSGVSEDGMTKEITNYTCSDIVDGVVTITYIEGGVTYVINFTVMTRTPVSIKLDKNPDKMTYDEGDSFDPTGMVVSVSYDDGSTKELKNFMYSDIVDGVVTITYIEGDYEFTLDIEVTVMNIENLLVDFEYTDYSNGTYSINSWKETLNGESSTEIFIPNSNKIFVEVPS